MINPAQERPERQFEFKGTTYVYEFRGRSWMCVSHPTLRETNEECEARVAEFRRMTAALANGDEGK